MNFKRNGTKLVHCPIQLEWHTLLVKIIHWLTFKAIRCEYVHPKMAAYLVGIQFAYIAMILKTIKLDPSWGKRNRPVIIQRHLEAFMLCELI